MTENIHPCIITEMFPEKVDTTEIVCFLGEMGLLTSEREVERILEEQDLGGYLETNFSELIQVLVEKVRKVNERKAIYEMFQLFDKDGNGYITAEELKAVMLSLGENISDEMIEEMIDEADMNGDNQIDFFEFVKTLSIDDDIALFSNKDSQEIEYEREDNAHYLF